MISREGFIKRTRPSSQPNSHSLHDSSSQIPSGPPENRFLEVSLQHHSTRYDVSLTAFIPALKLKPHRDAERLRAVKLGLIPDPLKPRRLDEALPFLGTCTEMCPEFELHEREFQNNSDRWERVSSTYITLPST